METRHAAVDTDLGSITLVATRTATGDAISGLYFRSHVRRPSQDAFGPLIPAAEDVMLAEAAAQLSDYLAGERVEFDLPLAADGDDFQHRVWEIVGRIPRGTTTTYGAIATQLAEQSGRTAADRGQAWQVGQAVGANPLCILVPCHRVVGAHGSLTGYAGGLPRKQALLALEEHDADVAGRLF